MKALTICQPYAHLICLPLTHPEHKRVENRTWYCSYRGPLAIHAGKSLDWLDDDELSFEGVPMAFGAIVATCEVVACLKPDQIHHYIGHDQNGRKWLYNHKHVEGPWCLILENVKPLAKPIPCRGAQGLWNWNPPEGFVA